VLISFFKLKNKTFLLKNTHQNPYLIISLVCYLQTLGLVFVVIRLSSRFLTHFFAVLGYYFV